MKKVLVLIVCVLLAGCAANKRVLFADKCVEKVQPMMRLVALFSPVSQADRKICECLAQKVDMDKVESLMLKTGEELNAGVAGLLVENLPNISACAKETGVLR